MKDKEGKRNILRDKVCFTSLYPSFPVRPPELIRAVIHPQNRPLFAHPTTNQRRLNEFRKESIYIPVRPCYNISKVDENGVIRARTKGRDTQDFPQNP